MNEERRSSTSVGARMRVAGTWGNWADARAPAPQGVATTPAPAASAPAAPAPSPAEGTAAMYDAATGLPTHILLLDRLDGAIKRAARGRQRVAVAMLELGDMGAIAERHGPAASEALAATTAKRLTALLRASDTVARLGAGEFAVVLEGVHSGAVAAHVAQKLLAGATKPCVLLVGAEGRPVDVEPTAAIGLAVCPDHGRRRDELLAAARLAMTRARSAGGVQLHQEGADSITAAAAGP